MKGPAEFEPAQIAQVPRISLQAFCESPETARIIQAAATDRRMERAHVSVHLGGALAAIEVYRDAPTPNVYKFLFDLTDDGNWLVDVHASS